MMQIFRWKEKDLVDLVLKYRENRIRSLSKWKKYERRYLSIANWLKVHRSMENARYHGYFWAGLHKDLQHILEDRIISQNPTISLEEPFPMDLVNKAAYFYFQRNRFATLVPDPDDEDDSEDDSDFEAESDSEESEDDDSDYRPHKGKSKSGKSHAKAHRKMDKLRKRLQAEKAKEVNSQVLDEPHMLPSSSKKRRSASSGMEQDEVEAMIKQLSKMSLHDPAYAGMYYRAIVRDSRVEKCLRPPILTSAPRTPQSSNNYQTPEPTPSNTFTPRTQSTAPYRAGMIDRCYGCFGVGHTMHACQKMTELVNSGIVRRDGLTRQYLLPDGSLIRREQGESLAQAAERLAGHYAAQSQNHLYFIKPSVAFEEPFETTEFDQPSEDEDYESDTEDNTEDTDEEELMSYQHRPLTNGQIQHQYNGYLPDDESNDSEDEYGIEEFSQETFSDDQEAFYVMPKQRVEVRHDEVPVYEIGPQRTTRNTRSTRKAVNEGAKGIASERPKAKLRGPPGRPPGIPNAVLPSSDSPKPATPQNSPASSSTTPIRANAPSPPSASGPSNFTPTSNGSSKGTQASGQTPGRFIRRELIQPAPAAMNNKPLQQNQNIPPRHQSRAPTAPQPHPNNGIQATNTPASESARELRTLNKGKAVEQPMRHQDVLDEIPVNVRIPRRTPLAEQMEDVEMADVEPETRMPTRSQLKLESSRDLVVSQSYQPVWMTLKLSKGC
jgi:hypothetical protein